MKYEQVVKAVNEVIQQYTIRLTVRQIYYRLISPPYQLFPNTIQNYKGMDSILTRAREKEDVDWRRIEDRARTTIGGDHGYDGPIEYVGTIGQMITERYYSKKMWDNQPIMLEVWVEKDALSSLFEQVLSRFNVLVFPSRGYSSFTKVMEAIEDRFSEVDKPITILHFTDHDPSGLNMTEDLQKRIEKYSRGSDIEVRRVMLATDQVRKYGLAPNPTKKADSRSPSYVAQYGDECWELDAVDPTELQNLVRGFVEAEIDAEKWNETVEEIKEDKANIKNAIEAEKENIDQLLSKIRKHLEE